MSSDVPSTDGPQQQRPHTQQPPPYPGYGSSGASHPPPDPWGGHPAYPGGIAPGAPAMSSEQRPGSVVAAAVIAMVMSALTGGLWLLFGIYIIAAGDSVLDRFRNRADFQRMLTQAQMTFEDFRDMLSAVGVVALVLGVLMLLAIIPAIGVLRRSRAARVILIVLSVLTVLPGLFFTLTGLFLGLLWVLAGIAVIVLLYVGGASAWFAGRPSQSGGSLAW